MHTHNGPVGLSRTKDGETMLHFRGKCQAIMTIHYHITGLHSTLQGAT